MLRWTLVSICCLLCATNSTFADIEVWEGNSAYCTISDFDNTITINLGWFDGASSNDGPATVLRIVIDVSDVDDADVSSGFGSVYFSQSGPVGKDDILVATMTSETATAESAPGMTTLTGNFYVKGE